MTRGWMMLGARMAVIALLLGGLALLGCPSADDDDTGDDDASADDDSGDDDSADDDATADDDVTGDDDTTGAACGPQQLCARSINECEAEMTMPDCLAWYQDPSNCPGGMDDYIACNCNCLNATNCEGYFGCGQSCFNQLCGGPE